MTVVWHPFARADLLDIVAYIAAEDPAAARRLHEDIGAQIGRLASWPESGRRGRVPGTRELVMAGTPYLAAYRIDEGSVMILRILHGARRWPDAL